MDKVPTKTIFVVFLVVLAFLAVQDFAVHGASGVFGNYLHQLFEEVRQDFQGWTEHHQTQSGTITRRANDFEVVKFQHPRGRVELKNTTSNEIQVAYEIIVYANRPEQAARYLSHVTVNQAVEGKQLILALKEPRVRDEGIQSVLVNYTVALPRGLQAEIIGSSEVVAQELSGSLVVEGSGSVTVTGLTGDIKINGCSSLEITGVQGNVWVVAGVDSGYIADITGNLSLENHTNRLIVGGMIVENLQGNLEARFDGHLLVNRVIGAVRVEGFNGIFEATHIEGPVTASGRELLINLRDIRGDTQISTVGRSNVLWELPKGQEGCEITALTRSGRIVTDIPLKLVETSTGEQKATGRIGNGRYKVDIKTEVSNIYLRSPEE